MIIIGATVIVLLTLIVWGIVRRGYQPDHIILHSNMEVHAANVADQTTKDLNEQRKKSMGDAAAAASQPGQQGNESQTNSSSGQQSGQQTSASSVSPPLSVSEQMRLADYQEEQEAMATPLKDPEVSTREGRGTAESSLPTGAQPYVANTEATKAPVLKLPPDVPSAYTRMPPAGRYMLPAGTWIPARLSMTVISELPGDIIAQISSPVYDKDQDLLIPFGAKIIGHDPSRLGYAQHRLLQVWDRIIFPDNSSINLDDIPGAGPDGGEGVPGKVDNHYRRIIANAAITTIFGIGIALSQRQSQSVLSYPSIGNTIGASVGTDMAGIGSEINRRGFEQSPTVMIEPGAPFYARTSRDIVFDGPYVPITGK